MARPDDVSGIESLERAWCDAWNAHDVRSLSALLLPDADFVTVTGKWLRGRAEFADHHEKLHRTQFRLSTFTVSSVEVKSLGPDLALAHVRWRIEGDFDRDGTPRQPRTGIFTQVLRKSPEWFILASQNTNETTPRRKQS